MSPSLWSGLASRAAWRIASIAPAASAARRSGWPILSLSVTTPSPLTAPKHALPPATKLKSLIELSLAHPLAARLFCFAPAV